MKVFSDKPPSMEESSDVLEPLVLDLPQPNYILAQNGHVMTDEQLETLRRQISVYGTICQQLIQMHKAASVLQQSPVAGGPVVEHVQHPGTVLKDMKAGARHRWMPSQNQLQVLERLFDQGIGTPSKQRIKEIAVELSQHGQITEANVYNWFQNRKARAKRRYQLALTKDGESEVDTDGETVEEKKLKSEHTSKEYEQGRADMSGHSSQNEKEEV
ncbi:hypothetical protein O6H91_04G044800 [Diphasiastrum complanatum]|uniref:Uncharacterized protein n=1 Tax=Diphasiastrum complanatum TaxID=34168 RepID=A0ACC2DWC9_DIPCM|nr:hypothetical protein O6H91_Y163000 [Diphasiastrum complanatum]KAJ7558537.1 hypothetical protein O6H91_04G044800 [Diphasiastrum complanatum]